MSFDPPKAIFLFKQAATKISSGFATACCDSHWLTSPDLGSGGPKIGRNRPEIAKIAISRKFLVRSSPRSVRIVLAKNAEAAKKRLRCLKPLGELGALCERNSSARISDQLGNRPAYNRISFAFIRVHLRFRAGTSRRNPFFAVWNRFRAVLDPFSAKNDASGAIFGLPSPKSEDFQHGWTRMDARTGKTARSGHF